MNPARSGVVRSFFGVTAWGLVCLVAAIEVTRQRRFALWGVGVDGFALRLGFLC